jgi:hypothetical protein
LSWTQLKTPQVKRGQFAKRSQRRNVQESIYEKNLLLTRELDYVKNTRQGGMLAGFCVCAKTRSRGLESFCVLMFVWDIVLGLATVMRMTDGQNTTISCCCRCNGRPQNRKRYRSQILPRGRRPWSRCCMTGGRPTKRLAACIRNLVRKKPVSSDQTNYVEQYIYTSGSDGARSTACIRPLVFVAKYIGAEYLRAAKAA